MITPAPASAWSDFSAVQLDQLGRAIVDAARDLGRAVPPPRGMPFYGLDHPAGEFDPFTRLAAHGIFRKYESVLLLGAGLGGAARWCHTHFGCDVTGIEPLPALSAAAQRLSLRAHLANHADFVAARAAVLPFRARVFTHVWGIEKFLEVADGDARLHEVFRTVRLGGLVALQQSGAPEGWAERAQSALASVGLVGLRREQIFRPPLRDAAVRARKRLLQIATALEDGVGLAAALERLWAAWPIEGGPITQVFARRPS